MRKIITVCLLLLLGGGCFSQIKAQIELTPDDSVKQTKDKSGLLLDNEELKKTDSIAIRREDIAKPKLVITDSLVRLPAQFKPEPNKALLYALIPGGGQIYNRKYWKLPIVYGGFVGLTYAITWNGRMYSDYSNAYKDLMTGEGDSWKDFVNPSRWNEDKERFKDQFRRRKDYFRRNRDLAIIGTVALYSLSILDAYVDAQLYNFDISPDLSMQVNPVIFDPTPYHSRTIGVQCNVYF